MSEILETEHALSAGMAAGFVSGVALGVGGSPCRMASKVFQEQHLMREGGNNEEEAAKKIMEAQQNLVVSPPTLYELIGLMHKHLPTSTTTALVAMSERVQAACASLDAEQAVLIGDFNRLRALVCRVLYLYSNISFTFYWRD